MMKIDQKSSKIDENRAKLTKNHQKIGEKVPFLCDFCHKNEGIFKSDIGRFYCKADWSVLFAD